MNKFSNKLTDARTRLMDANATLHFLKDRENLQNILDAGCPDVILGALIDQVHGMVSAASEDCELMANKLDEDLRAELRQAVIEVNSHQAKFLKGAQS